MSEELSQIKKIYGEDMLHLCRRLFPTLLDKPGKLLKILLRNIAPTRSFAKDMTDYSGFFQAWIISCADDEEIELVETDKDPFELMEEKGYILYECHSEKDIQEFRHYYSRQGNGETPKYIEGTTPEKHKGEELCTFDGNRLDNCYVFFAVKKNVDEIRRNNYPDPKREDEYGRSVISIQFKKSKPNTLSIKNRYNHTVDNPDATYGNNLENINPGLTRSFEKHYGLTIVQSTEEMEKGGFLVNDSILQYVRANDGRYYRYNIEMDGVYYCDNNIIIKDDVVITEYANNKERYIVIEQCVIDLKEKKVLFPFSSSIRKNDAFVDSINSLGEIKNIEVLKNGENRIIKIKYDEERIVAIEVDKNNAIVGYQNDFVKEIGDNFLSYNKTMKYISMRNVETIGTSFLELNTILSEIHLDKVRKVGPYFLNFNNGLKELSLPELEELSYYFMNRNAVLEKIYLPKVKKIGDDVLTSVQNLTRIDFPEVEEIGEGFLYYCENEDIEEINLPNVKKIGEYCFSQIKKLKTKLTLPKVEVVGSRFFENLEDVLEIDLPMLNNVGDDSLLHVNHDMIDQITCFKRK